MQNSKKVVNNYFHIWLHQDCAPVSSTEILCNSPGGFPKGTELRYGVALDGTTEYEDYSRFQTNNIEIVVDPVPTREDGEVQEYKPVFKTEITIEVRMISKCLRIFAGLNLILRCLLHYVFFNVSELAIFITIFTILLFLKRENQSPEG